MKEWHKVTWWSVRFCDTGHELSTFREEKLFRVGAGCQQLHGYTRGICSWFLLATSTSFSSLSCFRLFPGSMLSSYHHRILKSKRNLRDYLLMDEETQSEKSVSTQLTSVGVQWELLLIWWSFIYNNM